MYYNQIKALLLYDTKPEEGAVLPAQMEPKLFDIHTMLTEKNKTSSKQMADVYPFQYGSSENQ